MLAAETTPCEACNWENATIRRSCRNCSADLVTHPDPDIDREVRLDAADAKAYEASVGM